MYLKPLFIEDEGVVATEKGLPSTFLFKLFLISEKIELFFQLDKYLFTFLSFYSFAIYIVTLTIY